MDEHWVEETDRLFLGQQILAAVSYRAGEIDELVAKASDDEVLEADADRWARGLGADNEMKAPTVDLNCAVLTNLGRVEVDCTDKPGAHAGVLRDADLSADDLRRLLD